ncbi:MAG TPA: HIT domain-containing protein [Pyrinomonadaceae bacterium]|nr:HIT domain-containing protein [Pyrinomonadaceae bacterium]
MERLWSPWRHAYIAAAGAEMAGGAGCILCEVHRNPADDEKNFIVRRASRNFVILNLYPYISGHMMIAPYDHLGEFHSAPKETTDEMMDLAKRCQAALSEVYHPQGFNLGMNLGRAGGAGIPDHIHLHIMPRWTGDTNFISTVGETRVLSEDLPTTYRKLREKF